MGIGMNGHFLFTVQFVTIFSIGTKINDHVAMAAVVRCPHALVGIDIIVIAMAFEAPPHVDIRHLFDLIHGLDRTVTSLTSYTSPNVALMGKVNVVGKIVNFNPFVRLAGVEHRFEFARDVGAIDSHVFVATHT